MSHCNNGLNNHLINNIIETKVAKETGDLKYLQDSMREFIAALSDLITGKYSDHFLEEYVNNLFVEYKSTLEESLKIPQLKEEVTLALQRLSAQDKTVRQHTTQLSQLFGDVSKLENANLVLESVANLSTIMNPVDGMRVYVKSYHTGLGKGGGYFVYNSSRSEVDNKGTIINGWIREFTGAVTPLMFGAKGDGVTHDRDAFQAAIDSGSSSIYVPTGTYFFAAVSYKTDGINITRSDIDIYGDGASSVILGEMTAAGKFCQYLLSINRWDGGTANPDENIKNINIRNLQFKTQNNRKIPNDSIREHIHQLNIHAASHVLIENCYFTGFQGDGVHLGSSNKSGVERHNEHITIQDCLFDGVDNLNRNGVSIIDGSDINIKNNTFKRCTNKTQPGAIDIEPNAGLFHKVRNIFIRGNTFQECQGMIGYVCVVLTASGTNQYTVQPENFVITDNYFAEGNVAVSVVNSCTTYAKSLNLVIKNNTSASRLLKTQVGVGPTFWRGITVHGNTVNTNENSWFGFYGSDEVKDVTISNNFFSGSAEGAAFLIRRGSDINIINNTFNGKNISLSNTDVTSKLERVSIIGNKFYNLKPGAKSVDVISLPERVNSGVVGRECVYLNNIFNGTHNFPAWIVDTTGSVTNGTTANSFNTSTLPDDFPVGKSIASINGDTGVPAGLGGYQGTLITTRISNNIGLEHWTYQEFYHASNTLKEGSYYIRRRQQSTNKWTVWSEITN